MMIALLISSLILLLLPFVYWCYIYYVKFSAFLVLPGPRPTPLLGNKIATDSVGILKDMRKLYEEYKPSRFVIYTGPQVRVVHSDPDHIQYIVNSSAHTTKSDNFDVLKGWIGEGLATSKGDKWRERRKIINQSFNMNLMERFLQVFNSSSNSLVEALATEVGNEFVDTLKYTNASALEIACENLMGLKINPSKNPQEKDYIEKTRMMLRIVGVRFFSFWQRYESLFLLFSKEKDVYLSYAKSLKAFTIDVIEKRSNMFRKQMNANNETDDIGIKKKAALMDIMLEEHFQGRMSYDDIREEIDTFMVAGYDTSAGLVSFILYELARQPKAQKILYEEIKSIGAEGDFTLQQLNDMQYLDCAVKEGLRMYPQVPYMERQIVEEFDLDGIRYPVGTVFSIPIIDMQNDPDLFPDPETFNPARFLPENVEKIPKYNYLPFSAGPRICIGYKYAMVSAKCSVAKCVREFEILPVPGFQLELEFQITLKSKTGMLVGLKRRSH